MEIVSVAELSLPMLTDSLVEKVKIVAAGLGKNNELRLWLNGIHNNKINSVNQDYVGLEEFLEEFNQLYQSYFDDEIVPIIGVMNNVTNSPACAPTHCDMLRELAINYYVELGGTNVKTCFYEYVRSADDLTEAENVTFDVGAPIKSYTFETNKWYAYAVQRCHSVEDIQGRRIFVGLMLRSNPKFESFVNKYSNIVTRQF